MGEEATQQKWDIDWARFNGFCSEAKASAGRNDFAAAVRAYCHAISFDDARKLRNQRQKPKADRLRRYRVTPLRQYQPWRAVRRW